MLYVLNNVFLSKKEQDAKLYIEYKNDDNQAQNNEIRNEPIRKTSNVVKSINKTETTKLIW